MKNQTASETKSNNSTLSCSRPKCNTPTLLAMKSTDTDKSWWSRLVAFTILLAAGLCVSGCMLSFRSPEGFEHIELVPIDSAKVNVTIIWLTKKHDEPLRLIGRVIRQPDVKDTTASYVVVTFWDGKGRELRQETVYFDPRQIPQRPRPPPGFSVHA
jgi:hypothetical protein